MIRLTRSQVLPIGLDIGYDSIKMLQVETVGQTLSVYASARQVIPPAAREQPDTRNAAVIDLVRQMFRNGRFAGRRVVVALPREMLHVKNLRMPLIPQHELTAAVKFEAKNIFAFDTDKSQIQILSAGEVRQGIDVRQEVIVLAAMHEDVNGFLEQLHRCGAVVESLDVEACALYRSQERFIRRREDEQDVHVVVDVGSRRSEVVIGRGREISFIKGIDVGSYHFQEAVSRKLGITMDEARGLRRRLIEAAPGPSTVDLLKKDAVRQAVFDATRSTMEELGREIALCLRYYSVTFRGQRPNKLRLLGGEAADPMLLGVLNAALSIPVEAGRPLFSVDTSGMEASDRMGFMSEWALAFGLSLKLTAGQFAPRDGKPRDPSSPAASTAEVIDIAKAIENSTAADVIRRTDLPPSANGLGNGNGNALHAKREEEAHA
ncbi:MAG: type pilus assembly protein PilM [Humisphaera sp.]|nr:type pilus assembly protein PilM [Humisphaera sp.]